METHKQFSFIGNFKKLHEEDKRPIENFSANIHCQKNGDIFLKIDSITSEKLNFKRFYESSPVHGIKSFPQFTNEEIADPASHSPLDEAEYLIQSPYEGDYVIEGKTPEGWAVKAEIADFDSSESSEISSLQEATEDSEKHFVRLSDLCIDYHPHLTKNTKLEVLYGLANLDLSDKFSTNFLNSKYELSFIPLVNRVSKNSKNLSAEMTIKVLDQDAEEISYSTYFAWFELLISFATGKSLKEIYRIEINQSNTETKKTEIWSGSQIVTEDNGIFAVQRLPLHSFIRQCASKVTPDNFKNRGLGSALRWYVEVFTNSAVSVQFLLLCTVLETLKKHHSPENNNRLISTSIHKKNTDSLKTNLKKILDFYNVPYQDLFPELEFIKIRNKIVHEGFGGDDIFLELGKLGNLVARLFLSILQYQGDYSEYEKIETGDETSCPKVKLVLKSFPFEHKR